MKAIANPFIALLPGSLLILFSASCNDPKPTGPVQGQGTEIEGTLTYTDKLSEEVLAYAGQEVKTSYCDMEFTATTDDDGAYHQYFLPKPAGKKNDIDTNCTDTVTLTSEFEKSNAPHGDALVYGFGEKFLEAELLPSHDTVLQHSITKEPTVALLTTDYVIVTVKRDTQPVPNAVVCLFKHNLFTEPLEGTCPGSYKSAITNSAGQVVFTGVNGHELKIRASLFQGSSGWKHATGTYSKTGNAEEITFE